MKILHLATGWTISGKCPEFWEIEYLADVFDDNLNIRKYILFSMKVDCEFESLRICHKDSREITDTDRQQVVDEIEKWFSAGANHFLITHGTYTMPDTGKYIASHLDRNILANVSIILTGAMYPWNIFWSDAPMNIGAAISSLLNTEHPLGVKICMHGKNWDVNNIEKDANKLLFREITK